MLPPHFIYILFTFYLYFINILFTFYLQFRKKYVSVEVKVMQRGEANAHTSSERGSNQSTSYTRIK